MGWVRHRDKYPQPETAKSTQPALAAAAKADAGCCHGEKH